MSVGRTLALVLVAACGGPSPPAAPTARATGPASPACTEYVDASLEPRVKPDAVLTWRLSEGAPGYEYEMLLQINRVSRLSFVDVRWSEPGPNGLSDRKKAPGKCFTRTLGAGELQKLEATLDANHFCAQKVERPDPDVAPHRFEVHLGKIDCKVELDQNEQSMTPEGLAAYRAVVQLQREK